MFGLRGACVLGASAAVAGGVAYLIWNSASSGGEKEPEPRPREDGGRGEEEEDRTKAEPRAVVQAESRPVQSKPPQSVATQVLVLGLDGAGKTSLLHCFTTGGLDQETQPTQGFNAFSISREDLHIEFLEIGGHEGLRPFWHRYMSKAVMLVFVVDSSRPELFPVAREHLHKLLASDPHLPLMVLANKQDLPGSCGITDIHDALSLSEIGDRGLYLIGTYVVKGEQKSSGVQDAQDLIVQMVCEGR